MSAKTLHSVLSFQSSAFSPQLEMQKAKEGFTLIELMVAISIIAILAAIGIVVYSRAQLLARDSRRKEDLRAVSTALTLFYTANGRYPASGGATCSYGGSSYCTSNSANPWIPELTIEYMKSMPKDPVSDSVNPWWTLGGYSYLRCTPNSYSLTAYLENIDDPAALKAQPYKFCTGADVDSFGGWSKSLYVITQM